MCVIFYAEDKSFIQDLDLGRAWAANNHGAGIMALAPAGKMPMMQKGCMTLPALEAAIDRVPSGCPLAVHFRLKTHGAGNSENTHPFRVGKDSYLMHNGVLNGLGDSGDSGSSDSAHLARILGRLGYDDRVSLLDILPGKYILANNKGMTIIGGFTKRNNVLMSNTYWDFKHCPHTDRRKIYAQQDIILPDADPQTADEWIAARRAERENAAWRAEIDADSPPLAARQYLYPDDYYELEEDLPPEDAAVARAVIEKAMQDNPEAFSSGNDDAEQLALEKAWRDLDLGGVE